MKKEIIVERLEKTRDELLRIANIIPDDSANKPMRTDWQATPHQILSHIIGWDIECLKAARDFLNSKRPSYENIEDSVYFAKYVNKYKNFTWANIINSFISSRNKLIDFINNTSQSVIDKADSKGWIWESKFEEIEQAGWEDPYKKDKLKMEFHTIVDLSWHDKEHTVQLKEFIKNNRL